MTDPPVTAFRLPIPMEGISGAEDGLAPPGEWPVCHGPEHAEKGKCLNRMKILKKTFAIGKAFDYISAPRQTQRE
ncbi:hypothetical protein KVG96_15970 [Pseudomonas sp. COR58]|uniref:Uncharacterized protein n=1 Tax=Pseudomonas ekonensis TaxID=2842353 RepID=A0ABS6PG51_9PSED|nr:hypothetical protein [Pseudomonas ekonensis]MBV4459451.1 hypothetical protein [Pseudomonas ekonensis]